MGSVLFLLIVVASSMLVTKVATVALVHTGMARESARFQARSAFTGVGFTTAETESVVKHPVRRRIIMWLMLLGNVGIVSAVATLVLSFAREDPGSILRRFVTIMFGIIVLVAIAYSPQVDYALSRLIGAALRRWTTLDARDYASLLHLVGDYSVKELEVEEGDWLVNQPLGDLRLSEEGVLVLGIQRSTGAWLGAPRRETCVRAGDVLLLYGREQTVRQLDRRRDGSWGDREHRAAADEMRHVRELEEAADRKLEEDVSGPPLEPHEDPSEGARAPR